MIRKTNPFEPALLVLLALAAWFGVLLQFWLSLQRARENGLPLADGFIAYFGFFTVLSNIFIAMVAAVRLIERGAPGSANVRGCATTAILFVGLAYHFLLRKIYEPQGWHLLADVFLHYIVPFLSLAHWVLFPPAQRPAAFAPVKWSLYPCVYFGYLLVRGELIGTYPYFFIDVRTLGYPRTLANAAGLLVCFVILGFAVLYLTKIRRPAAASAAVPTAIQ